MDLAPGLTGRSAEAGGWKGHYGLLSRNEGRFINEMDWIEIFVF